MNEPPLLMAWPGQEPLARRLAEALGGETGTVEHRRFADGESRVRLGADVDGRDLVLCATLRDPDALVLPLLFAADAARELGARRVVLAAPYLAYMRQDARFHPREAVSVRSFARLISASFDGLATVDPHLHRIHDLGEVYTIPSRCVTAAPLLAAWIRENVESPLVVGPDAESEQWAAAVAEPAGCPWAVLRKTRHDDRRVEIVAEGLEAFRDRRPVVVDDLISTAGTACETLRRLAEAGLEEPVVLAVHGLFVDDAEQRLRAAGATRIVTTDSVPHSTNALELAPLLAPALRELLEIPSRA